jgi:hypothetical protein
VGGSVLHWLPAAIGEGVLTLAGESIPCLEEAFLNVPRSPLALRLGQSLELLFSKVRFTAGWREGPAPASEVRRALTPGCTTDGLRLERPIDRLSIEPRIDARMGQVAMVHSNKTPESVPLHLYVHI